MAKSGIPVKKSETLFDELEKLHQAISLRAYDLFRNGGLPGGDPITNWLTAERELIAKPPVELRQKNNHFEVIAALPGVHGKDLDIRVTSEDLLITAASTHEHTSEAGTVHICEFEQGKVFRSIHFPERIDPDSVKAEYKDGLLHLTAEIARAAAARKVEIQAA